MCFIFQSLLRLHSNEEQTPEYNGRTFLQNPKGLHFDSLHRLLMGSNSFSSIHLYFTAVSSGSFGPRGKIIYGAAWPIT